MFMFSFRGYMAHAFPHDDLRPLSCRGHDTQGGFGNTLVDVLDTLVVRAMRLKSGNAAVCAGARQAFVEHIQAAHSSWPGGSIYSFTCVASACPCACAGH